MVSQAKVCRATADTRVEMLLSDVEKLKRERTQTAYRLSCYFVTTHEMKNEAGRVEDEIRGRKDRKERDEQRLDERRIGDEQRHIDCMEADERSRLELEESRQRH